MSHADSLIEVGRVRELPDNREGAIITTSGREAKLTEDLGEFIGQHVVLKPLVIEGRVDDEQVYFLVTPRGQLQRVVATLESILRPGQSSEILERLWEYRCQGPGELPFGLGIGEGYIDPSQPHM